MRVDVVLVVFFSVHYSYVRQTKYSI